MTKTPNVVIDDSEWKKPRPQIDHDNAAFWAGLQECKLLLWHCKTCGAWYWPKTYCRHHPNEPFAANMAWTQVKGTGKLFAFNRHHTAFHPGFKDEIPYVYALIELDEGPLISSTLMGDNMPRDVYDVGQRVEIVYEHHPRDGFTLPRFRIVD
jgi:uncharacterized protein